MPFPPGRVLVVDDDDLFLRVCGSVLRRAGATVETVSDPSEALRRVERSRYDAIVSDVCMPEVSGLTLLKAVREIDNAVPFVLMTGAPSVESAITAIDLGVHKYLPKPFDVDAFVGTVGEAIQKRLGARDITALNLKLDRGLKGLWMAYQPIISRGQGGAMAYEALLRTSADDVKGPGEMLELAEKTGRLHDLGRTIRASVASELPRLDPSIAAFVNLHPIDLEDPELYDVHSPLARHATRVVLEITERASVTQDGGLADRMRRLRALGYRIAVDDLGAGYSGLTTLARVQPEFVKLDASLVRDIDVSTVNQVVVTAVLELAAELESKVVAEAIETRGEFVTLADLGVDLMQGYLFARPAKPFVQPEVPPLELALKVG